MADTYDIIICGAGSGGGFLAGEVARHASVLLLDAGPHISGDAAPGIGAPQRRAFSTQVNLGYFIPDGVRSINSGSIFYAYPSYLDQSNPLSFVISREARVVGGGSFINVGAWVRPRSVDWPDFERETGVVGWTREAFEPHFLKAERIFNVHRERRENWNKASILYEQTANRMGIPVFETASNRKNCIFCGHRLDAGMPCKYDSLMSTTITQIPKAVQNGTVLVDNATVLRVEIQNRKATGVTYRKDGKLVTANARKLVVVAAGAIGTPLILLDSGLNLINQNVGKYLRAHPATGLEAFMPGDDWASDRGYQWNCFHYPLDDNGQPVDVIVHASAGLANTTPWIAAQVGFFGKPYKDMMRSFKNRAGAFFFQLKPDIVGRVMGSVERPVITFPMTLPSGILSPKILNDFLIAFRRISSIYRAMGAITMVPNVDQPDDILKFEITQRVMAIGVPHPQGTCRAGVDKKTSVVDSNLLSHDIENLMCCDASVIPKDISCNPNATIMAVASRASDFVITNILGRSVEPEEFASRAVLQ